MTNSFGQEHVISFLVYKLHKYCCWCVFWISKQKEQNIVYPGKYSASSISRSPYQRIIFSQDLKSAPATTDGPGLRNGPIGNPISTWDIFLSQEPCPESPFLFQPTFKALGVLLFLFSSRIDRVKHNLYSGLTFLLPQGMCTKVLFTFQSFTRKLHKDNVLHF